MERWNRITEPTHDREKRALELLRKLLPDRAPFAAWANFEFLALDGAAFDVDALIVTESGVFLIEFAPRRGKIEAGPRTWVHTQQNGERAVFDNPYQLAERKVRLLRSLLDEHTHNAKAPHIEPVVWLTEPEVEVTFRERGDEHLVFHPDVDGQPGIDDVILCGDGPAVRKAPFEIESVVRDRIAQALDAAGIGRSGRHRRYGDWRLRELLHAGPRHQDWVAEHVSRGDVRRVRIFSTPRDIPDHELVRLQEAARREFQVLQGLQHPNILPIEGHVRSERRPGLLFQQPEGAMRLDHWLDGNDVSVTQKLNLLSEIAEAVRYAHRKSVVHRALTPQSVLVVPTDDGASARVFNWHTSRKEAVETGTAHVHDYMDDIAQAYLAPELARDPRTGEPADIYGVGAIAFRLFAGRPPAASVGELVDVLVNAGGLRPSRLADGVPEAVDDFVFNATRSVPTQRMRSMTAVIDALEHLRQDLAHDTEPHADPLEARPGEELDGRFEVVRRIGVGSTATALLVKHDGKEVVLKVANNEAQTQRLRAEADVLERLEHKLIVDLLDTVELGGRFTLVLQNAGTTVSERLKDGALSLDELRRYGEDLCDVLVELESHGVLHRDIKPANLGIGSPVGSTQRLMLFDFSLADVPLDAYDVGTPLYNDPFLRDARRRRWDEYADRYSACVTLYEMTTGARPQWGDGQIEPLFDDTIRCNVESHLFPASVRDPLERFFQRAFQREVSDRFDNAIDMREAWRETFAQTTHPAHDPAEALLSQATTQTRVATLGLSDVARDALDRLDVVTVHDLLGVNQNDLQFQKGIAHAIRKELADLRARLVEQFPVEAGLVEASEPDDGAEPQNLSVDQLLDRLTGRLSRDSKSYKEFVAAVLGEQRLLDALPWKSVHELAERTELEIARFQEQFQELRESWERKRVLTPLRDDVVYIVENNHGAISDKELALRVLGLRGSILQDSNERLTAAAAVARAAVEAELAAHEPRIFLVRVWSGAVFVATREDLRDALPALGERAEQLVKKHGIVSPARAEDELQKVLTACQVPPLPRLRLLALAAEASKSVALSSRNELYPVELDPTEALKLCAGIFVSGEDFTPAEIASRVRQRYPQVAEFPGHPDLGQLLRDAGLKFKWDTERRDGDGAYVNQELYGTSLTRSTLATSFKTSSATTGQQYSIRERFHERLTYKQQYGGFLALTVDPRELAEAERWLTTNFELELIDLDELFIRSLRDRAAENEIDWSVILEADTDRGADWGNLMQLLQYHVVPAVRQTLLDRRNDLLLTNPGLLARYADGEAMSLLTDLYEAAGTSDGPRMVWLLVPADHRHSAPMIEQQLVPTMHGSEHARVPIDL